MENKEPLTKKNLKRRLSEIMIVYMDGLSKKKQLRLEKYLDTKIDNMVSFYMDLIKKKKRKVLVLKPLPNDLQEKEIVQEAQIG